MVVDTAAEVRDCIKVKCLMDEIRRDFGFLKCATLSSN